MWSGVAIARTAMSRNVWKATPSAQSARACAPMPLIPSTPKRCGPGAKRWWARPSDRPAKEQFFPSDRRMALGAMLPPPGPRDIGRPIEPALASPTFFAIVPPTIWSFDVDPDFEACCAAPRASLRVAGRAGVRHLGVRARRAAGAAAQRERGRQARRLFQWRFSDPQDQSADHGAEDAVRSRSATLKHPDALFFLSGRRALRGGGRSREE